MLAFSCYVKGGVMYIFGKKYDNALE